jgi:hypothetical protein
VSLFGAVSTGLDTHDQNGNFRNFFWAFTTLFRSSTGEAWNEIMHDLAKDELDYFHSGEWCSPSQLFDWQNKYDVLKDKCLIENPNMCVQTFGGWNGLPVLYWFSYTLIIAMMIMNLVITVILDGYEEGKESPETEVIEKCIKFWKRIDPDQTMETTFPEAVKFINDVVEEVNLEKAEQQGMPLLSPFSADSGGTQDSMMRNAFQCLRQDTKRNPSFGCDIAKIPMKFAKAWDLKIADGGKVTFVSAAHQVLRFTILEDDTARIAEIEEIDAIHNRLCREFFACPRDRACHSSPCGKKGTSVDAKLRRLQKSSRLPHLSALR